MLSGKNEIDVEGKSIPALLIDEVSFLYATLLNSTLKRVQVIHPFYVFQIASIILWSLDDYYYYAFCIGLISFVNIVSTLVETRKVGPRFVRHSVIF